MSQQLLSFYCRMWRDTSISSSTFLISLTNCCHHFLAPGVLMIGGEVCSTPKEATRASRRCLWATTSPSCPARRGWKCCFDASKIIGCIGSNIMVFVCGPLWYGSCISAPIFLVFFSQWNWKISIFFSHCFFDIDKYLNSQWLILDIWETICVWHPLVLSMDACMGWIIIILLSGGLRWIQEKAHPNLAFLSPPFNIHNS